MDAFSSDSVPAHLLTTEAMDCTSTSYRLMARSLFTERWRRVQGDMVWTDDFSNILSLFK